MSVRNRAEMNLATIIPTSTAAPVHTVWPRQPPEVTEVNTLTDSLLLLTHDDAVHVVDPRQHDGGQLGPVTPLGYEGHRQAVEEKLIIVFGKYVYQ